MKRLAVLGHPVAHSRSPAMQNAALAELGFDKEWHYGRIDVAPEELEERVRAMPGEGFVGANVTIPHKEAALALSDVKDPVAREIGAANTLVFRDSRIEAHNSDARGLIRALRVNPNGIRSLVLGAGGAGRAAIWALSEAGSVVEVWNRTAEKAVQLVGEMDPPRAVVVPEPDSADYGIIVNTTAVGLHGEDPFALLPIDQDRLGERTVVDMVYGDGPSTLSLVAGERGANVVDGLEILVQQGAHSLAIWLEVERLESRVVDAMRKAAYDPSPDSLGGS